MHATQHPEILLLDNFLAKAVNDATTLKNQGYIRNGRAISQARWPVESNGRLRRVRGYASSQEVATLIQFLRSKVFYQLSIACGLNSSHRQTLKQIGIK